MQTLMMQPEPGERVLRFVGDRLQFSLRQPDGDAAAVGWRGYLRTNLGRARQLRKAIIHAHTGKVGLATSPWRDIPMRWQDGCWQVELALTEVGCFKAKAYLIDAKGWQHWPEGPDIGVSVHPDVYRTANTIYCAFPRLFGPMRGALPGRDPAEEARVQSMEDAGYAVLPPSGKLRDLIRQLPHIFDSLGCRILHLLPVHPTPTTYGRFGRFGSPYACQDLLAVDPALVEFDRRSTGVEQFQELTRAVHGRGGQVFLDVVINHTGWGSDLQERHPEWFVRRPDGSFVSPGAWGVTWEDLAELHHQNPALWEYMAEVFLEWCRRGVDGFRCDAGYKIPVSAWQYITARVQEEFPQTMFLLEGLGGSWEATEALLTEGGMQWAYSELFQNYSGSDVARYLDYSLSRSRHVGVYVHYSETHDNDRLAKKGRAWSLLRNRLCALSSVSGAFGFTCGVEWLAREKIDVHQRRSLSWDNPDNLIPELSRLNQLLAEHPCFFDHAQLNRLSNPGSPVLLLSRVSAEGADQVLVLVNTDLDQAHKAVLEERVFHRLAAPTIDLLTGVKRLPESVQAGAVRFALEPGAAHCLASTPQPRGLRGEDYRRARAQAAWAWTALSQVWPAEVIGPCAWLDLARLVSAHPARFLASLRHLDPSHMETDLLGAIQDGLAQEHYPNVILWQSSDASRCCPVPPEHWLLVEDTAPFRVALRAAAACRHAQSVPLNGVHLACFPPAEQPGPAQLVLERYGANTDSVRASLRFLDASADVSLLEPTPDSFNDQLPASIRSGLVLLTNGRGGMSRMMVDLGRVQSKYDCVLGANLHPQVPTDRHIFIKRARVWVNADGFIVPLNGENLVRFSPGPPAEWCFVASAGDGRAVEIQLVADMLADQNTVVLHWSRPSRPLCFGTELPESCHVSLTVRLDLLDRNFHFESHFNPGTEHHFVTHVHPLQDGIGFKFVPAPDRQLWVWADAGQYHPQSEWCMGVEHPIERSRGQVDREDAYSPGWFDLPLPKGGEVQLMATSDVNGAPDTAEHLGTIARLALQQRNAATAAVVQAGVAPEDGFGRRLAQAIRAFVVRRDQAKTVVAGYPWFLDWGRDSLICARGLMAAGLDAAVRQLLITFGRFVDQGTLPNSIHGEDTSNRDTSDAPLWYGLVADELGQRLGSKLFETRVQPAGRTIRQVLQNIGEGYVRGTPNGICLDSASGLIWSPAHFTWMDTNHPAGTPREGYPVEIQALWIHFCQTLSRLEIPSPKESWSALAERARRSLDQYFWLEDRGCFADLLHASSGQPASAGVVDTAVRSNFLVAISLGLVPGRKARRAMEMARQWLVVPGAVRSLAPLPVSPPLPIRAANGRLLNNPDHPYCGRYEGDEDTQRKLAYHNGTAWTWTLPIFCEALAQAWDFAPTAVQAARSYLGSMGILMTEGCLGYLPEILDGDAPHSQRGCDAQAWSATEALRVWKRLQDSRQV